MFESIVDQLLTRKQCFVESKTAQVADAHGIEDAEQVIDFVVIRPARESHPSGPWIGSPYGIEAAITQLGIARLSSPRMPGTDRQPSQPSSNT